MRLLSVKQSIAKESIGSLCQYPWFWELIESFCPYEEHKRNNSASLHSLFEIISSCGIRQRAWIHFLTWSSNTTKVGFYSTLYASSIGFASGMDLCHLFISEPQETRIISDRYCLREGCQCLNFANRSSINSATPLVKMYCWKVLIDSSTAMNVFQIVRRCD
jgi:hypothetical protein